jgi:hypothetical protein
MPWRRSADSALPGVERATTFDGAAFTTPLRMPITTT